MPGETRAAAEIWHDNECVEGFHVRGRLAWCDSINQSESKSEQWKQWQEWLATAGMLLEFVDTPPGCTESADLRLIPNPLRRWIYLLHEFDSSPVFTWDLSPVQIKAWWQICEELGHGHYYHKVGDEWVPGAAAGERLPLDGICTIDKLPVNFHVCSEVRDVLYESERLLDVLEFSLPESSEGQPETPSKPLRKRGRPKGSTKYDQKKDKRLYEAWNSGGYKTQKEVDDQFGETHGTTMSAVDRHRKKLAKDRERAEGK